MSDESFVQAESAVVSKAWIKPIIDKARAKIESRKTRGRWMVERKFPDGSFVSFYQNLEQGLAEYSLELQSAFEASERGSSEERVVEAERMVAIWDTCYPFASLSMHVEVSNNKEKEAST